MLSDRGKETLDTYLNVSEDGDGSMLVDRESNDGDDNEDFVPESLRGFLEEADRKFKEQTENLFDFDDIPKAESDAAADGLDPEVLDGLDQVLTPADEDLSFMSPSASENAVIFTNPAANLTASEAKRIAMEDVTPDSIGSNIEDSQDGRPRVNVGTDFDNAEMDVDVSIDQDRANQLTAKVSTPNPSSYFTPATTRVPVTSQNSRGKTTPAKTLSTSSSGKKTLFRQGAKVAPTPSTNSAVQESSTNTVSPTSQIGRDTGVQDLSSQDVSRDPSQKTTPASDEETSELHTPSSQQVVSRLMQGTASSKAKHSESSASSRLFQETASITAKHQQMHQPRNPSPTKALVQEPTPSSVSHRQEQVPHYLSPTAASSRHSRGHTAVTTPSSTLTQQSISSPSTDKQTQHTSASKSSIDDRKRINRQSPIVLSTEQNENSSPAADLKLNEDRNVTMESVTSNTVVTNAEGSQKKRSTVNLNVDVKKAGADVKVSIDKASTPNTSSYFTPASKSTSTASRKARVKTTPAESPSTSSSGKKSLFRQGAKVGPTPSTNSAVQANIDSAASAQSSLDKRVPDSSSQENPRHPSQKISPSSDEKTSEFYTPSSQQEVGRLVQGTASSKAKHASPFVSSRLFQETASSIAKHQQIKEASQASPVTATERLSQQPTARTAPSSSVVQESASNYTKHRRQQAPRYASPTAASNRHSRGHRSAAAPSSTLTQPSNRITRQQAQRPRHTSTSKVRNDDDRNRINRPSPILPSPAATSLPARTDSPPLSQPATPMKTPMGGSSRPPTFSKGAATTPRENLMRGSVSPLSEPATPMKTPVGGTFGTSVFPKGGATPCDQPIQSSGEPSAGKPQNETNKPTDAPSHHKGVQGDESLVEAFKGWNIESGNTINKKQEETPKGAANAPTFSSGESDLITDNNSGMIGSNSSKKLVETPPAPRAFGQLETPAPKQNEATPATGAPKASFLSEAGALQNFFASHASNEQDSAQQSVSTSNAISGGMTSQRMEEMRPSRLEIPNQFSSRLMQATATSQSRTSPNDRDRDLAKERIRARAELHKKKLDEAEKRRKERVEKQKKQTEEKRKKLRADLDRAKERRARLEQNERERLQRLREKIAKKEARTTVAAPPAQKLVKRHKSNIQKPALTIPVGPKLATASRPGRKTQPNPSPDRKRKVETLANRSSSTGRPSLTVPQTPKLATAVRHGDKTQAVPVIETAKGWEGGLRSSHPAPSTQKGRKLTIPQGPKFHEIHKRALPKSSTEKEQETMQFYKTHPFKAKPVHMSAADSVPKRNTGPARKATSFQPFHFRTDDRAEKHHERDQKKQKGENNMFKARPMPDFSSAKSIPLTGIAPTTDKNQLTIPVPFHLHTDDRSNTPRRTASVKPVDKKRGKRSGSTFRARSAPTFKRKVPLTGTQPKTNKPVTKPAPFRFQTDTRASTRSPKRNNNGEQVHQFRARPMPNFANPSLPIHPVRSSSGSKRNHDGENLATKPFLTKPLPNFSASSVPVKSKHSPKEEKETKEWQFRARPVPDFSKPALPVRPRTPGKLRSPDRLTNTGKFESPTKQDEAKKRQFRARPLPDFSNTSLPVKQSTPIANDQTPFRKEVEASATESRQDGSNRAFTSVADISQQNSGTTGVFQSQEDENMRQLREATESWLIHDQNETTSKQVAHGSLDSSMIPPSKPRTIENDQQSTEESKREDAIQAAKELQRAAEEEISFHGPVSAHEEAEIIDPNICNAVLSLYQK